MSTALVNDLALETECSFCYSPPGVWCVTRSGGRSSWLHTGRTRLLFDARRGGYREGYVDALDQLEYQLQNRREGAYWTIRDHVPLVGLDVIGWLRKFGGWAR